MWGLVGGDRDRDGHLCRVKGCVGRRGLCVKANIIA